jgi:hypothetical protein
MEVSGGGEGVARIGTRTWPSRRREPPNRFGPERRDFAFESTLSENFMSDSKSKTKSVKAGKPAESRFVATAKKAMRKAQHTAARENARYGLTLIVTR